MFTLPKRDLVRALERAAGIASKRAIQPILKCARLSVAGSTLTVQATDLTMAVTTSLPVTKSKRCDVAIEADVLLTRVKSLEDGDVTVDVSSGKSATVRTTSARKFTVPIASGEDFPMLAAPADAQPIVTLPSPTLRRLLDGVRYASSTDETRAFINSVLLRVEPTSIFAAGTDGHRMAARTAQVSCSVAERLELLVPRAGIAHLIKIAEGDGNVTLAHHGTQIVATKDDTSFLLRTVEAQFPPVDQFLGMATEGAVTCDRARLVEGIKAVVSACDQHGRVSLALAQDKITVSASSPNGEFVDEMSAALDGRAQSMSYMHRYISEALESVSDDTVTLRYSGELDPVVIRTADTTMIVMPMRV